MLLVKGKFLKTDGLTNLAYSFEVPIDLPHDQITLFSPGIICLVEIPNLEFVSAIKVDTGSLLSCQKKSDSPDSPVGKILWVLSADNSDQIIQDLANEQQKTK
ncbi:MULTISPECIES: hypothetical protein [Pediococcus]|uniref:hypothetical protein n=1 Tax=Pediococcus TaxID=1253 RepID=UPI000708E906|nr:MULTISPECIES: hypothetical protein [Pediococcus]AVL00194.1 hypothetical protein PI20285_05815 [Pediococcus inopinatus]KRN61793.1 hypothetical protein IV83_GL000498 [Pediococcus inopinatus]PIO80370.1 hypothetical protein BSQ38_01175 [Pediococcus damnosus]